MPETRFGRVREPRVGSRDVAGHVAAPRPTALAVAPGGGQGLVRHPSPRSPGL